MSLKSIKNKIRSVNKTHKVTKAMEAVSAVKMRKSQERALITRPYAVSALTILRRVGGSVDAQTHLLTEERTGTKTCILLVTSDKGLAGSLNNAVIRETARTIKELAVPKENVRFLCIGRKGYEHFSKRGYTVLKHYDNFGDEVDAEQMRDVTHEAIRLFKAEEMDKMFVSYTNFISTFEQKAAVRKVLPITLSEITKIIESILPKSGKYSETKHNEKHMGLVYKIEPDPEEVFEELLPFLLNIELYHALIEAKASEHSARMVAMKNASDKAEEMSEELTLMFNKARQTLITREVSEITSGMEVMNKV